MMATSQELLHVDPGKESSPFLIKNEKYSVPQSVQQPPKITRLGASSVLSRAKNFIPLLADANCKLKKDIKEKSAEKFNVENVEGDEKFIEMNIGIFARDDKETDSSSSDESDSENSDEDFIADVLGEVTEDNIKLRKDQKYFQNLITEIQCKDLNGNANKDIGDKELGVKNETVVRKMQKCIKQQRLKNKKH